MASYWLCFRENISKRALFTANVVVVLSNMMTTHNFNALYALYTRHTYPRNGSGILEQRNIGHQTGQYFGDCSVFPNENARKKVVPVDASGTKLDCLFS
jgi:hypothetical protein